MPGMTSDRSAADEAVSALAAKYNRVRRERDEARAERDQLRLLSRALIGLVREEYGDRHSLSYIVSTWGYQVTAEQIAAIQALEKEEEQ